MAYLWVSHKAAVVVVRGLYGPLVDVLMLVQIKIVKGTNLKKNKTPLSNCMIERGKNIDVNISSRN